MTNERLPRTHTLRIDVPLHLDEKLRPYDYDVVQDAVRMSLAISRAAYEGHICDDVMVEMLDADARSLDDRPEPPPTEPESS